MELLAQHCYVQLGASVRGAAVQELLPSCVPSKLYKTKPPEKWASLVTDAHTKVSLHSSPELSFRVGGGRNPNPLTNRTFKPDS